MPSTKFESPEKYQYLNGLNSYHESEAMHGAVPVGMTYPQRHPLGLYNEKLSGTAFTVPRHESQQTSLYRILPAVGHKLYEPTAWAADAHSSESALEPFPNQIRWTPFDFDKEADWINSLRLLAGAGDPTMKTGLGIYTFSAGKDMKPHEAFVSSDGDFLIVPQHGTLDIQTELGWMLVRPHEICVIPRGVRYRVNLPDGPVRGFILELYQGHFALPELGPLGSHGLAIARDFQVPIAAFEDDEGGDEANPWRIYNKYSGRLFVASQAHTPFDVVGWHGTYYPYKYDLARFVPVGPVSFDHLDPSIFTVLTAQSDHPGLAIADFVVFPSRWCVANNTFRPPYYHRNCMSEFVGLISGEYDGKDGSEFQAGCASLHNVMTAHGPDLATYENAVSAQLKPEYLSEGNLAFMFETSLMLGVTKWALEVCGKVQEDYSVKSWGGLKRQFKSLGSQNNK